MIRLQYHFSKIDFRVAICSVPSNAFIPHAKILNNYDKFITAIDYN